MKTTVNEVIATAARHGVMLLPHEVKAFFVKHDGQPSLKELYKFTGQI